MISTATKTLKGNNKTIYVALLSTLTFFLFLDYIPCLLYTSSPEQLREYLAEVLPNFDRDRVHVGDIKKLISWYNTLISNGLDVYKRQTLPCCLQGSRKRFE